MNFQRSALITALLALILIPLAGFSAGYSATVDPLLLRLQADRQDKADGHRFSLAMERIMADVATLFREVFTKELQDGGYELVEEQGANVLIVKPAIVDLNVYAPDIKSASRTNSYSESAGEMTLNLELYDSVTGDKIAKATDRKRDYDRVYMQWRTSVSNRADARRMMTPWAEALRSALDEAKSSTSSIE